MKLFEDITFNIVIVQSIERAENSFSLSTDEVVWLDQERYEETTRPKCLNRDAEYPKIREAGVPENEVSIFL